jgi:hypothetical protein
MFADAVGGGRGRPEVRAPRRDRPIDDVLLKMCELHLLGVVRALSGALDCLAGVVIGVAALPTDILKADFGVLLGRVLPGLTYSENEGGKRQVQLAQDLGSLISSCGPSGWLEWLLDYRNMLVHRGRRLTISQIAESDVRLYGPNGNPLRKSRVVRHLPKDPARSEVEVMRRDGRMSILNEDAGDTIQGVIGSTRELVQMVGTQLVDLWQWRRQNPTALRQPMEQWKRGASDETLEFVGYKPGSHRYQPRQIVAHPDTVTRLRSAAL